MPEYVYALFDFAPENPDEIQFKAGERIEVVEKDDVYGDGWWQVSSSSIGWTAPLDVVGLCLSWTSFPVGTNIWGESVLRLWTDFASCFTVTPSLSTRAPEGKRTTLLP